MLYLNGTPLEHTDRNKYLRLRRSPNISRNAHIEEVLLSPARSIGYISHNLGLFLLALTSHICNTCSPQARIQFFHLASLSSITESIETGQSRAVCFVSYYRFHFSSVSMVKTNLGFRSLS